jgi:hypothetical protein
MRRVCEDGLTRKVFLISKKSIKAYYRAFQKLVMRVMFSDSGMRRTGDHQSFLTDKEKYGTKSEKNSFREGRYPFFGFDGHSKKKDYGTHLGISLKMYSK